MTAQTAWAPDRHAEEGTRQIWQLSLLNSSHKALHRNFCCERDLPDARRKSAGTLGQQSGTGGRGLVKGLAVLDSVILKVFFKWSIPMILCLELT